MTAFTHTSVHVGHDRRLWIDGNSKISGSPPRPNALSLPAPECCPGSTEVCRRTCFASCEVSKIPPELRALYEQNHRTLLEVLSWDGNPGSSAQALGEWIDHRCPEIGFRWHVSGDVIDGWHARWIVAVCRASPNVQHWIYTRSLFAVPILVEAENLSVNVSADRENLYEAYQVAHRYNVRLCYLWEGEPLVGLRAQALRPGSVIFPGYGRRKKAGADLPPPPWRAMVCPGDYYGQEGPVCGTCTKCGNPKHVTPLSCPHCGHGRTMSVPDGPLYRRGCQDCGALGPAKVSPSVALAAWNLRAADTANKEYEVVS